MIVRLCSLQVFRIKGLQDGHFFFRNNDSTATKLTKAKELWQSCKMTKNPVEWDRVFNQSMNVKLKPLSERYHFKVFDFDFARMDFYAFDVEGLEIGVGDGDIVHIRS